MRARAQALDLPEWEVDGTRTADEMTALVAEHDGLRPAGAPPAAGGALVCGVGEFEAGDGHQVQAGQDVPAARSLART